MTFFKVFILCSLLIESISVYGKEVIPSDIQEDYISMFPEYSRVHNYQRIINYQLAHNLMVVKAYVNGQYGNFIIDTGAETLILNAKYFSGNENHQNHAVDVNGSKVKYQESDVKFGWDMVDEKTKFAIITDMSLIEKIMGGPILGNIGYNILKNYEITIDNRKRTIMLVELDRKGNYINAVPSLHNLVDIIELKANGCKPYLVAHFKGKRLKFSIDTGAESSVLRKDAVKKIEEDFIWKEGIKTAAYNGKVYESKNGILPSLNIKANIWKSIKVSVANKWNSGSYHRRKLDGLLGNDFLHQKIVSINFIKREMYLLENRNESEQKLALVIAN